MAFVILNICLCGFFLSWHSRILMTKYPLFLRILDTSLSRFLFFSILSFQYFLFDFGILPAVHNLHPCQKHPSTNTHSICLGKKKSGFPKIFELHRHPHMRFARKRAISLSSVLLLPLERICDITSERFSFDTESTYTTLKAISYALCSSGQEEANNFYKKHNV